MSVIEHPNAMSLAESSRRVGLPRHKNRAVKPIPATPWSWIRAYVLMSGGLIAIFVVGVGYWSATAPLTSAAIASGTVVVETNHKTIQHFEGGIIGAILVRDGDIVAPGQPLIRLGDTKARTNLAMLQGQLWDALASEARLTAERDNRGSIAFPAELLEQADDPAIARVQASQVQLFRARQSALTSKTELLGQRVKETQEEIAGLKQQVAIAEKQIGLAGQELAVFKELASKGLDRKSHVLQLERGLADIDAKRSTAAAQIARAEQTIIESQIGILNAHNEAHKEVADASQKTRQQIHELREKIQNATDVMERTIVRAPEAGVVTDLRVHTTGGVIKAGDPLMDLVPQRDRTIIEAQVRPDDIAVVRTGLRAEVRLLPYKQRRTRPIKGEVTYVSADRLVDKDSHHPYYAAKIRIDEADLAKQSDIVMQPGMPSEVMIQTGETTVALYALSPLLDSFHRAFREK